MSRHFVPGRGDIIWLNFDPQAGHEQAGRRPAVVLSVKTYNARTGLCIVCPVTSRIKGYPFESRLPDDLSISGAALSDHVRSVDWKARKASFISRGSADLTQQILAKLSAIIFSDEG
jgi:mRNA interferase MazF